MDISDDFIERYKSQIGFLRGVEKAVKEALDQANKRLSDMQNAQQTGGQIEDIFGPIPPKQ